MVSRNKPYDVFKYINMHGGDESVCWEWTRSVRGGQGRPYFDIGGTKHLAYRLVYELTFGPIPEGNVVRHKCDNPICCSPHHLELGTHDENMDDMKKRERHGLPHHTVRAIKRLFLSGDTDAEIAEKFGLTPSNVSKIRQGITYQHVTVEVEKTND